MRMDHDDALSRTMIIMFQTLFFGNPDISNSPALKNMLRFTSPFVSKKTWIAFGQKIVIDVVYTFQKVNTWFYCCPSKSGWGQLKKPVKKTLLTKHIFWLWKWALDSIFKIPFWRKILFPLDWNLSTLSPDAIISKTLVYMERYLDL